MRRLLAASVLALSMTTAAWPAAARPQPAAMTCADGFEAVCAAIGAACGVLDVVDEKVLKKNLIDCQLG